MYKEIKYNDNQKGYGLAVTNPVTKTRALIGIFENEADAYSLGQYRLHVLQSIKNPKVVQWNKKNYNKYDYVFTP